MAKADPRQCQDMVAKDTEVLWSGEKIPSSGRRYPPQPVLRPPSNRAKAAKVRQLASFFRRIRSVRDWLAERGEFEPRDPRLRACSAWIERETNSIEAPPAPGRPIALSESRSTSKMRSFPGSPSRIGPESHREQQEVSKIYGEGLLRRGLERGTTLGGLFPWAATFS
jgi:hypothetical protein